MNTEREFEISQSACTWTVRAMTALQKRLGIHIKLHQDAADLESGQIFLFNHFARIETFIPQYLIYRESGAFCRSIAAAEFFTADDAFAKYLRSLGGVPNDYPRLLPFLAEEILRGRKVIIFPEGGLVKDRRVLDKAGGYSIYSRTAKERRKHHTGAAVLALTLEAFKLGLRSLHAKGEDRRLDAWAETLGMDGAEALLAAAAKPTLIVPSNITFYPIRITDNVLQKGVELFTGGVSKNFVEEMRIEGNILFKETDMDIRLGDPVRPADIWSRWERTVLARVVRRIAAIDELFALRPRAGRWESRFAAWCLRRKTLSIRDQYMHGMYAGVTVNLSHLASRIILTLVDQGQTEVERDTFHKALYLAIKKAQEEKSAHLHESLRDPDAYRDILDGRCRGLQQFMSAKATASLVKSARAHYRFLPKLHQEHAFDQVRLENLISVYANEVAPIAAIRRAVDEAVTEAPDLDARALAHRLFDDERRSYAWDQKAFSESRHAEINRQETATESGEPYLLLPQGGKGGKGLGIVLVHGFLASPAEVRGFADRLGAAGYPVIGVRLKGHGTSPWDLRERRWQDWFESLERGYRIMSAFAERLCVVGFSTGGTLALHLAAAQPEGLAGACVISAPFKFRNRALVFVPLMHGANLLTRWVSSLEGIMPFMQNESEHPHINYRNVPMRGLYELRRLVDEVEDHLGDVRCPVSVIQGDNDRVVDAESAAIIVKKLGSADQHLHMVPSERHGILHEDIGGTQDTIMAFIEGLESDPDAGGPDEEVAS